ncbi:MAG: Ribonuclease Z [Syntrophorhabdaceae bacterium PtaU1.Bin034]|nr:MAG: Ribonuclease Z [Syntrophorhabdaceae bacterium PtaU1.Bin034]
MKIKILGTGTAVPSLTRLSSSYLVLAGGACILLDIGPSVVRRLLEAGCRVNDIDVIVLTHFHPDHTVDLTTFLFACNYGEAERQKPLVVVGGKGVRAFYRKLARLYPWIVPLKYEMTIKTLSKGAWKIDGSAITTVPTNHRGESIGVRIEEKGKTAVFSGDTDYSPEFVRLASRADLLVIECSFPEYKAKGHLNLPAVLTIVKEAKPKRVIMSHLYPAWEEFNDVLPPPLLLGEDGLEIEI